MGSDMGHSPGRMSLLMPGIRSSPASTLNWLLLTWIRLCTLEEVCSDRREHTWETECVILYLWIVPLANTKAATWGQGLLMLAAFLAFIRTCRLRWPSFQSSLAHQGLTCHNTTPHHISVPPTRHGAQLLPLGTHRQYHVEQSIRVSDF